MGQVAPRVGTSVEKSWHDQTPEERRRTSSIEFLLWSLKRKVLESTRDPNRVPLLSRLRGIEEEEPSDPHHGLLWNDDLKTAILECHDGIEESVRRRRAAQDRLKEQAFNLLLGAREEKLNHTLAEAHILLDVPWKRARWQAVYYNSLRVRAAYFLLVSSVVLFCTFCGLLTETLIGGFMDGKTRRTLYGFDAVREVCFALLPFGMLLFALIVEKMYGLALDAFDNPPLIKFQGLLLAVLHPQPTKAPHPYVCLAVDITVLCLFEVFPLSSGVIGIIRHANDPDGRGLIGAFYRSYVWGGLLWALVATVMRAVCETCLHGMPVPKDGVRSGDAHEANVVYVTALHHHKVFPFHLWAHCGSCFSLHILDLDVRGLPDVLADMHKMPGYTGKAVAATLLCWALTLLLKARPCTESIKAMLPNLIMVCILVVIVSLSTFYRWRFPKNAGCSCVVVLTAFCIFTCSLVFSSSSWVTLQPQPAKSFMKVPPSLAATYLAVPVDALPQVWLGRAGSRYGICERSWGSQDAPLSSLDLAQLSNIVYEPHCERMPLLLNESFAAERNRSMGACNDYDNDFPRWASFFFGGSAADSYGTLVVAVKGTSTKLDGYRDAVLWSAIKVLQLFQSLLPVLTLLPVGQVQWLISVFHLPGQVATESRSFDRFQAQVQDLMNKYPKKRIVLTGHSLGGGVAQIVAAKLNVSALVFSSPGMVYSALRFKVASRNRTVTGMQVAKRNIAVVIPEADVVPRVDKQAGVVQPIECRNRDGVFASSLECHSLMKTACEVWRVCGDPEDRRDFRETCEAYVGPWQLGAMYATDDVE